jgi:flagellar biosynthesis/type III secretory pathway M-ring protein FliF/YscJ
MSLHVHCPEGHEVAVGAAKIGAVAFCPHCYCAFTIKPSIDPWSRARKEESKSRRARDDDDEDDDEEDEDDEEEDEDDEEEAEDDEEEAEDEDDEEDEADDRKLCPDGACIGVIGPEGRCKVCGKEAA